LPDEDDLKCETMYFNMEEVTRLITLEVVIQEEAILKQ
jgi:hypothetical protein